MGDSTAVKNLHKYSGHVHRTVDFFVPSFIFFIYFRTRVVTDVCIRETGSASPSIRYCQDKRENSLFLSYLGDQKTQIFVLP